MMRTDKPTTAGARKDDNGKPSVWQGVVNYFPRALQSVAEVSTFGSKKYAWGGWKHVPNGFERYQDAKYRHALAFSKGETHDPESKLLHLAHEAWGALAALELYIANQKEEPEKVSPEKELFYLSLNEEDYYSWVNRFVAPLGL